MKNEVLKLGFILPSGGTEHEYYQTVESSTRQVRAYLGISRDGATICGKPGHSPEALRETAAVEHLVAASERLSTLDVDSVMWACTSGSFIRGKEHACRQAAAIADVTGTPASSTTLAFLDALDLMAIGRVAIWSPYPNCITRAFIEVLEQDETEVVAVSSKGLASGWDSAELGADTLQRHCKDADTDGAEALIVPDTALCTLSSVQELEESIDKPVLTANAVTIWKGFDLINRSPSVTGCGRLLAVNH